MKTGAEAGIYIHSTRTSTRCGKANHSNTKDNWFSSVFLETTWTGSDNPVTVSIYLQTLVAYIDAGMQPYYQSESVSVQVRVPVYVVLVLIWYSTCIVLVDGKQ